MVVNTLQHLIYGRPIIADQPSESPDVLAISPEMDRDEGVALYQHVPLDPLPVDDAQASQAVALLALDQAQTVTATTRYVLARAHYQRDGQLAPVYQYVLIPAGALAQSGDLDALFALVDEPIPPYTVTHAPLEPLPLPQAATWTLDKGVALLKTLLDDLAGGDLRWLLALLNHALTGNVVVQNFPLDSRQRQSLMRGLRLLLPSPARLHLTFSTYSDDLNGMLPRVVISDAQAGDTTPRLNWMRDDVEGLPLDHPYVAHLLAVWDDDMIALAETIRSLDMLATYLMADQGLDEGLAAVVARHQLDLAVMRGEAQDVAVQTLLNVLQSAVPLADDLRLQYVRALLEKTLASRDPQVAQIVAQALDEDPHLDTQLGGVFDEALDTQPDAVYAFVRARLSSSDTMDEKWLERLHNAANHSLNVALESGDAATISSWLTLLSREPLRYNLGDILRRGLLGARQFASEDNHLAQDLLVLAVKRQPETIADLLSDTQMVNALPDTVNAALRRYDPDAIEALPETNRELFLLALHRAVERGYPSINNGAIRTLWDIHTSQQTNTLPPQFRPHAIIEALSEQPAALLDGALDALLSLVLASGEDVLFFEMASALSRTQNLDGRIAAALEQSGRPAGDLLELIGSLLNNDLMSAQAAVDTLNGLLTNRDWSDETLPLVEQLSRVMTQHPDTQAVPATLWRLAERSGDLKNEQMLKVAQRRLLDDISEMVTETTIVENVQRLRRAAQWSLAGRTVLLRWWRLFVRSLGLGQLQKLDKELDGKRSLEDLRAVVQTTIALRRVIGTRTLTEFSGAVSTTYALLQALSEGFDTDERLVDGATIRGEIDARSDELPPDQRHVLATNLKELAQLVTSLADNRSKPSLIRSDDTVERQLVTGEQQPQSAIDVLRWLSGYLDGMQKNDKQGDA